MCVCVFVCVCVCVREREKIIPRTGARFPPDCLRELRKSKFAVCDVQQSTGINLCNEFDIKIKAKTPFIASDSTH